MPVITASPLSLAELNDSYLIRIRFTIHQYTSPENCFPKIKPREGIAYLHNFKMATVTI